MRQVLFLQGEQAQEAINRIEQEGTEYLYELLPSDPKELDFAVGFHPDVSVKKYPFADGAFHVGINEGYPTVDIVFQFPSL